jgi:hypothetical protein
MGEGKGFQRFAARAKKRGLEQQAAGGIHPELVPVAPFVARLEQDGATFYPGNPPGGAAAECIMFRQTAQTGGQQARKTALARRPSMIRSFSSGKKHLTSLPTRKTSRGLPSRASMRSTSTPSLSAWAMREVSTRPPLR